ncbi:unnamed protein product [Callosobruchus maculatus]|uniref:Uncharacterized protein n=1 Tax=Callosobruchus maculatus TaxID=64391 RepID=A0A653BQL3_CALMS|nr:unnamed protein product [Callosobruchus maculatus]
MWLLTSCYLTYPIFSGSEARGCDCYFWECSTYIIFLHRDEKWGKTSSQIPRNSSISPLDRPSSSLASDRPRCGQDVIDAGTATPSC